MEFDRKVVRQGVRVTILRWVLFANDLKLLVPGGSAVVGFLFEPGDHVFLMIHVNRHMVGLPQSIGENPKNKSIKKSSEDEAQRETSERGGSVNTHVTLVPFGQIEVVGEEASHSSLLHLLLQHLQQVGEPLEGVRFPAQPVEVDLQPVSQEAGVTNKYPFITEPAAPPRHTQALL